jgi:actin-related protein 10
MYTHLSTTPIGGKAFLQRLKRLILRYGTYTPPRKSHRPIRPDPKRRPAPTGPEEGNKEEEHAAVPGPVPEDVLDWWILEDIRSRGCFVGPVPIQSSQRPDAEDDLQEYAKIFSQSSEAKDATFNLRRKPVSNDSGCGTLHVPGWIRERASEVFFEEGDVDALSVVEVILSCLTVVSTGPHLSYCCAFLTPSFSCPSICGKR